MWCRGVGSRSGSQSDSAYMSYTRNSGGAQRIGRSCLSAACPVQSFTFGFRIALRFSYDTVPVNTPYYAVPRSYGSADAASAVSPTHPVAGPCAKPSRGPKARQAPRRSRQVAAGTGSTRTARPLLLCRACSLGTAFGRTGIAIQYSVA